MAARRALARRSATPGYFRPAIAGSEVPPSTAAATLLATFPHRRRPPRFGGADSPREFGLAPFPLLAIPAPFPSLSAAGLVGRRALSASAGRGVPGNLTGGGDEFIRRPTTLTRLLRDVADRSLLRRDGSRLRVRRPSADGGAFAARFGVVGGTAVPPAEGRLGEDDDDDDDDVDDRRRSRNRRGAAEEAASEFCRRYLELPLASPGVVSVGGGGGAGGENPEREGGRGGPGGTTATAYGSKDEESREEVIRWLVDECGTDDEAIERAVEGYHRHILASSSSLPLSDRRKNTEDRLRRVKLSARLSEAIRPGYEPAFGLILSEARRCLGMRFLVQLRHDLRIHMAAVATWGSHLRGEAQDDVLLSVAKMKRMDSDLRRMLSAWFSSGILELRRITYDTTPASIIEKIALKEAVHPLRGLDDLRVRLGPGRRCFAFFHPSLPDEPLVFVHVALMPFTPEAMEQIEKHCAEPTGGASWDGEDPPSFASGTAAVFYSITSTQPGLVGVELGNFLIKRVVEVLRTEFPGSVGSFVTLSPIPGFRRWLSKKLRLAGEELKTFADADLLTDAEKGTLRGALGCDCERDVPAALLDILDTPWHRDEGLSESLRPVLMRLAARYLAVERHRGQPLDPVARFHVRNGAEMYRLNFLADRSRRGMHGGAGIMVNYRYRLNRIEENHAAYEEDGLVPVMKGVMRWLHQ